MNLQEIKKNVNLREYARSYHGLVCNSKGLAKCPFHRPDNTPSFAINFDDGIWKWYDPHDKKGGTIIEFEARFANCSTKEAIKNLLKRFRSKKSNNSAGHNIPQVFPKDNKVGLINQPPVQSTIRYIYKDEDGEAVLMKEKRILLDGEKTFLWFHKKGNQWKPKMGGCEHIPYNLDQFNNHEKIIICEGEKDADTINDLEIGEFATSAPNGAGNWPPSITQYFKGKEEVVFLYDVGAEGSVRDHASELKRTCPEMKISIATVPLKEKNADITDYLNQFKIKKEKQIALADVLSKDKEFKKEDILPPAKLLVPISICLADVFPEPVEWLWFNKFPLGKICLLVGDPGVGKSFFCLYMAAKITTGRPWPDINMPIKKGSVIYLSAEDDASDTIRPRADAMGADVNKIYIFNELKTRKNDKPEFFNLEYHTEGLSYFSRTIGDTRAIFIDDINSYTGKLDTNNIAAVRSALLPIIFMAREENITVLFTSHLNKDKAQKALFRTIGSIGYMGVARSVWAISRDPEDTTYKRRYFTSIKNNLSINPQNLAFNFTGSVINNSKIEFEPYSIDITSDEALAPGEEQELGAFAYAEEWLTQLFENENDIPAGEILTQAKKHGIAEKTLKRVKKKLGLQSLKEGMWKDRQWIWRK